MTKLHSHTLGIAASAIILVGAMMPVSADAAQVSGAIFTTNANGVVVNENQYSSKSEVYLDGGPGPNAPASAAGLPDGDYYFQVTDASGKKLLSTDPVMNRRFQVAEGVIVAYTGEGDSVHPTGYDQDHPELGAITIRLANGGCPADYLDSSNGVYKVWATPVTEFVGDASIVDTDCGHGCFHGFVPSKSKTDNFKARTGASSFCVTVWKRLAFDGEEEVPGPNWKISITDPVPVANDYYTDSAGFLQVCGLTAGNYIVTEDPQDLAVRELIVNGIQLYPQPGYYLHWSPGEPEPVIIFKNGQGDLGGPED